jgi:Domain of unknown function (DUF4123)
MPYPHPQRVIHHLWQWTEREGRPQMYAILDAARHGRLYPGVLGSESDYRCLYRGELSQELAQVAPYLVALQRDSPFTAWLISQGWGDSWGIFLASSASLDELRRHFRRFLMVYDEQGRPLYFRYYDPRVLRVYLPTCNESELQVVFGPVSRFYIEGTEPDTLVEFSRVNGELQQRVVVVGESPQRLSERQQT